MRSLRLLSLLALSFASSIVSAQSFGEGATNEHRAGVGLAASIYTGGISGIYDVTDQVSAQAILGALGSYTSVGGKVLYRFNQNNAYDVYGFGGASLFSTEGFSTVGIGGGAGLEVNWARVFDSESFPPLYSQFELGLSIFTGDNIVFDNLGTFGGGFSLHYRF